MVLETSNYFVRISIKKEVPLYNAQACVYVTFLIRGILSIYFRGRPKFTETNNRPTPGGSPLPQSWLLRLQEVRLQELPQVRLQKLLER